MSGTSKTYKLKVQIFENGKPEEFLQTMKDLKTGIDRTGTTPATRKIQFQSTILYREAMRKFDIIIDQVGSTNNTNLKQIKEDVLRNPLPFDALNKQKRAMRQARRKPLDLQ